MLWDLGFPCEEVRRGECTWVGAGGCKDEQGGEGGERCLGVRMEMLWGALGGRRPAESIIITAGCLHGQTHSLPDVPPFTHPPFTLLLLLLLLP